MAPEDVLHVYVLEPRHRAGWASLVERVVRGRRGVPGSLRQVRSVTSAAERHLPATVGRSEHASTSRKWAHLFRLDGADVCRSSTVEEAE